MALTHLQTLTWCLTPLGNSLCPSMAMVSLDTSQHASIPHPGCNCRWKLSFWLPMARALPLGEPCNGVYQWVTQPEAKLPRGRMKIHGVPKVPSPKDPSIWISRLCPSRNCLVFQLTESLKKQRGNANSTLCRILKLMIAPMCCCESRESHHILESVLWTVSTFAIHTFDSTCMFRPGPHSLHPHGFVFCVSAMSLNPLNKVNSQPSVAVNMQKLLQPNAKEQNFRSGVLHGWFECSNQSRGSPILQYSIWICDDLWSISCIRNKSILVVTKSGQGLIRFGLFSQDELSSTELGPMATVAVHHEKQTQRATSVLAKASMSASSTSSSSSLIPETKITCMYVDVLWMDNRKAQFPLRPSLWTSNQISFLLLFCKSNLSVSNLSVPVRKPSQEFICHPWSKLSHSDGSPWASLCPWRHTKACHKGTATSLFVMYIAGQASLPAKLKQH